MIVARKLHTATLLPDGKVFLAGGYGANGILASAELYDPATFTWASAGSTPTQAYRFTVTLLPSGKVLVAGGSAAITASAATLYAPATNTWSPVPPMSVSRRVPRGDSAARW